MRTRLKLLLLPVLLLALVALVGGCGGSNSGSGSDDVDATTAGAGALTHVDGSIVLGDDGFTLTPEAGGEEITFSYGPEVERAAIRAIAAAGTPARVSYRPTEQDPIAASVEPAPVLDEVLQTYEGTVTSIEMDEIVIDGDDGERRFTIAAEDREAFDVAHLRDHAGEGDPVRVYFDPAAPDAGIAYEDG